MDKQVNRSKAEHRLRRHDGVDMITICLSDGPKTITQLEQYFIELPRRFGMFVELFDREALQHGDLTDAIAADLQKMARTGLVEQQGEYFQITHRGQEKYSGQDVGIREFERLLRTLAAPVTVGKVSLAVHLLLAAIKLPAGIISGSIGLLNDAIDTLLDGLSSILVLLGFRYKKERASNLILVVLMLATGTIAMAEALQRLFNPALPQVDWFTFFSALFSAVLCAGLYFYQRFVGLRSGSLALITQSVDSRNHIIVAVSVTAGLIAALLDFPLLDTIVGLIVAAIILYSAIELAIDLFRNFQSGEPDLSRFSMGITQRYHHFRTSQLRYWLLFTINEDNLIDRDQIIQRAMQMLDFSTNPALAQLGLNNTLKSADELKRELTSLQKDGLLEGSNKLKLTEKGYQQLSDVIQHKRFFQTHFQ